MPNFQPQVNYNVPILEARPFREVSRPEVNVQPIDISGFAKTIASAAEKKQATEQAQAYEGLKAEYAAKYDEIEVALSQGEINPSIADIMKRSYSAESKMRGLLVEDDIKLRKNYGAPIESLDKLRLERIVKEEQEVLENERKHYRTTLPSLEFASNSEIDSLINTNRILQDTYEYNKAIADNPYATEFEKEQAKRKLTDNVANQAYFNSRMIATNMMVGASERKEIDPNFRSKFLEDAGAECQRLGMSPAQGRIIAESAWRSSGAADYYALHQADIEESTKYAKTMQDNLQSTLDLAGTQDIYNMAKKYPGAAGIIKMGRLLNGKVPTSAFEAMTNSLAEYKSDIIDGKAGPKYLQWNGVELGAALQGYNIIFKDSEIPNEDKVAVGGGTVKALNDSADNVDIKNASKEDLKTLIDNSEKVINTVDDKASQSLANKYTNTNNPRLAKLLGDRFNQLAKARGKVAAAKIVYNIEAPAKALLTDSIQSDRLRYLPKTGELVLTEDSTIWQDIGNQFNDNKRILDGINNSAKNTLSTDETINGFKALGIKELQPGESAADLSGFNLSRAVSRPRMSLENPEKNAEAINRTWTGEVEQPIFTDEIPLEHSSKVSNSDTVGGAWADNDSAQALRQYADRLEASVESVKSTGAKTEKGKLENDIKLIKEARALADKMEGVTTSRVSNRSTIGGANLVTNDDREMAIAPDSEEHMRIMEEAKAEVDEANYEGANEDVPFAEKKELLQLLEDYKKNPDKYKVENEKDFATLLRNIFYVSDSVRKKAQQSLKDKRK